MEDQHFKGTMRKNITINEESIKDLEELKQLCKYNHSKAIKVALRFLVIHERKENLKHLLDVDVRMVQGFKESLDNLDEPLSKYQYEDVKETIYNHQFLSLECRHKIVEGEGVKDGRC